MMDVQFLQLIIAALVAIGSGVGMYAAIKSDLTRAIIMAEAARDEAIRANTRIDQQFNLKVQR